jgi:hypothetical protein
MSATAATGKALNVATISFACSPGSASTTADANGNYSVALTGAPPCIITATTSSITLHSVSFAGGTFNTTPETDLLLTYLAAQLGTTQGGLIAGFASNTRFPQVLGNSTTVLNAQSAVVANLQQQYSLTLSAPAFLTTVFTVGQPGVDSDLVALQKAGAIDAIGQPDPTASSLMANAGAAQPLPAPPPPPSSTGGSNPGVGFGAF